VRVDLGFRTATRRAAATGAALLAVAGAVGLFVATGGAARTGQFVSESGVADAPRAALYRLSILGIAAAVALLALSLRALSAPAAALLAAAAGCVLVSGSVACSAGCPLPPHEVPTLPDLAHAAASIAGLLLISGAMLVLARPGRDRLARQASRAGAVLAVPLQAAAGLSILFAGRGAVTGALERAALIATLAWLLMMSLLGMAKRGT
jgi:hypothetical protein